MPVRLRALLAGGGALARRKGAQAQGIEADEPLSILLIVGALVVFKGDERAGVKRLRRFAPRHDNVTLIELEPHGSFHIFLALVDQRLKHLAFGGEPEAIIDEFGVTRHHLILEVGSLTVKGQAFNGAVGGVKYGSARRLVDAARLHADKAILNKIYPANAVVTAKIVQGGEERRGRHRLSINGYGIAFLEFYFDIRRRVGGILGGNRALINIGWRFDRRVLKHFSFRRGVEEIRIDGKRRLAALIPGDRDLMLFGKGDQVGTALERPFAPRGNDSDVMAEDIGGELKAHLVVAFAGGAVSDGIGTGLARDLDQPLGNERTRDRGAQKVNTFVKGVGAEHGKDEVARSEEHTSELQSQSN